MAETVRLRPEVAGVFDLQIVATMLANGAGADCRLLQSAIPKGLVFCDYPDSGLREPQTLNRVSVRQPRAPATRISRLRKTHGNSLTAATAAIAIGLLSMRKADDQKNAEWSRFLGARFPSPPPFEKPAEGTVYLRVRISWPTGSSPSLNSDLPRP